MAKNSFDYKEKHGYLPLWTTSMFSGMPAYQIALEPRIPVSPVSFYNIFTLGLPKPISFFFLACICFYFLTQVLRVNPYIGIIGALAYAYATYNVVIIGAGHDTKMQTIALMPALIGSIILVYEGKYLWGAALTALFSALLIAMNHLQIAYYTFLIAGFMTIGYLFWWIRQRAFRHLFISLAIVALAGAIGVLSNAVSIFTTYEYAKASIRGGTELPDQNTTKGGLSKDYALSYSLYKTEPFVMMAPNIYGGSSEPVELKLEQSKAVEALQSLPQEIASQIGQFRIAYWGGIVESAGTSGPSYVGAIICFLSLIGFFILDSKHKWWILAASVMAIMMSWGHYFDGFNSFLLKALPMYNKFRAPSMTLVIPTFLFGMMAMLTLQKIVSDPDRQELWNRYKKGLLLTGGVFLVLLMVYFNANYTSESDKLLLQNAASAPEQVKEYIRTFLNALKDDRKSLFIGSLIRSFLFIAATAFVLWLSVRKKLGNVVAVAIIGILVLIDILSVDSKYLNAENYKDEAGQAAFTATPADEQVLRDKSYYRVFDLRQGLSNLTYGAGTAYFHHSIGGYHPAKLSIYQDLIEHQLMINNVEQLFTSPASMPVVNMLNAKYIMFADPSGKMDTAVLNPGALGPAWFVNQIRFENTPQSLMAALTHFHPADTAIVLASDRQKVSYTPSADSSASIQLDSFDNDEIRYTSNATTNRFAVFSEVFYDKGWKAYIDDKEAPIIRTDYVLRGLSVPAGRHQIRFAFHPASYYTGNTIALIAGLVVFLLLIAALVQEYRTRRTKT
jgi:hypothetical protein